MRKLLSKLMTLMLMVGMMSVLGACSKDNAVAEEVPEEEVVEEEPIKEAEVDNGEESDYSLLEIYYAGSCDEGFYYLLKRRSI